MNIKPVHAAVGDVFGDKTIFSVPKYQRGYAWDSDSVQDFISDVDICYRSRLNGAHREHFLGGILSVKSDVEGVANAVHYQLVDGQQRITTIVLFAYALMEVFGELVEYLKDDPELRRRVEHYVNSLKISFVSHEQVVNRVVANANVLTLSRKDEGYFRELLGGHDPESEIDSHEKLSSARSRILKYLNSVQVQAGEFAEQVDALEQVHDVLLSDFSLLHMVAENKPDAYRLFQVINDRGVSLTDGDLLRVKTLELLEGYGDEQLAAEKIWDDILSDKPNKTYDFLQWIYESHAYKRARSGALADLYMESFFGGLVPGGVKKKDAKYIIAQLRIINEDVERCRAFVRGEWIFPDQRPVTPWDRARLASLVVHLGHTLSIPLLLAASELGHVKFRDVVLMLERAFFRYKIICNEHVTPLKSLYYVESEIIRTKGAAYSVQSLRDKLGDLLNQRAPLHNFINGLTSLHYQSKTGGNKSIKHFLMMLDSYYAWYESGAVGAPKCLEGNRLLDFGETSIEHIYPKNAKAADVDVEMEPRKNSIGNLTILDPEINTMADNDNFTAKRGVFKSSTIGLNQKIGKKHKWNLKASVEYEKNILEMARHIFVI
ncbi:DUF262 domain-containing HNH endonuclease family protein [Pseudomonas sp. 32.2.56]|uniref:DUF262 domain-containing protein n=1 Tax=Pseudomonas sp. 32.2.56 TaxID=2969303 RepID=UPI00214F8379|nr:DUF262 domain-containing HNH endonuclease family protein [Pseudomonas sp. 32.2.56]MCR4509199.1 DUF262 domain-containing HNH endonuclease family protein [Pseudomonas sp. 32.2.56]